MNLSLYIRIECIPWLIAVHSLPQCLQELKPTLGTIDSLIGTSLSLEMNW